MLYTASFGLAVLLLAAGGNGQANSGSGRITRYWDCCKPSCAWRENAGDVSSPVRSCAADGTTVVGADRHSGCDSDGDAYMCTNQQPFVSNNQAYGFTAASGAGVVCCGCYRLRFTSTSLANKTMIVQVTNTGSDVGTGQFDMATPGGGLGQFPQGCPKQWPNTTATSFTGSRQYGGFDSREQCNLLPLPLRPGCEFRFDWFENADNPDLEYTRIPCPSVLTNITGCTRADD